MSDTRVEAMKPPRARRLLILACSEKKRPVTEETPGWLLYNGPLWQTLRAADPKCKNTTVFFFSARYGLRDATDRILPYDEQLTEETARRAKARGLFGRWKAPPYPGFTFAASAFFCNGDRKPFTEIALVGGHLYLGVMRSLVREAQAKLPSYVPAAAHVVEINDQIGLMRRQLREWLAGVSKERATSAGSRSAPATVGSEGRCADVARVSPAEAAVPA